MNTQQLTNLHKMNNALSAFKGKPSLDTLFGLTQRALDYMDAAGGFPQQAAPKPYLPPLPRQDWITTDSPDAFSSDWYEIRAVFSHHLSAEEIEQASGCIGYALKEVLAGEDLSEPYIIASRRANQTILLFAYDSTKSLRSDPDPDTAFLLAGQYVRNGTPVRRTNRAGYGTRGTRLVDGIGPVNVQFAVR